MTLWAIHPHPCNDEVLSSWITRIAYANQMKISAFCKFALKAEPRQLSNIDFSENEEIFHNLSKGTGVCIDRIYETSLLSESRYVFAHSSYTPISWVVPTKYKRQALSPGLNFCPQCLDGDTEPYFRKFWRFSFYPVCTFHNVLLRQLCPQCQRPYQYLDSSRLVFGTSLITICKYCGFDIRRSPVQAGIKSINEYTAAFQEILREGIKSDSFDMSGDENIRALEYLGILREAMSLCSNPKYAAWIVQQYREEFPPEIENSLGSISKDYRPLEQRGLMELNVIMVLASTLLKDWPVRRREMGLAHDFHVSDFRKKLPTPFGFDNFENGTQSEYEVKFSIEEILSARMILYRKLGKFPSKKELALFMIDGIVRFAPRKNSHSNKEIVISPEHFVLEAKESLKPDFKATHYIRARKENSDRFRSIRRKSAVHWRNHIQPTDCLSQLDMFDEPKKPLV